MPDDDKRKALEHKAVKAEHSVAHLLESLFAYPQEGLAYVLNTFYVFLQWIIVLLFEPHPPKTRPSNVKLFGRVAVVGAGLTGVSSAAHAAAHGFDVVIYEQSDRPGGIWAHVNRTSGLQLNSLLYRFFPGVVWKKAFPYRDEILSEIRRIWKEYDLESRTRLSTPVTSISRVPLPSSASQEEKDARDPHKGGHSKWIVNDGADGEFDAIIVSVGTCGEPQMVHFDGMPQKEDEGKGKQGKENDGEGQESGEEGGHSGEINGADTNNEKDEGVFLGPVVHSSQLDSPDLDMEGKVVAVIGSGASGVEAVETSIERGAKKTIMLARDDKWVIPRNIFIGTLISAQPFGREMPLSFIWEWFLTKWHYRGVEDLVPAHRGLFEGTPVVNDLFLSHVRYGTCEYYRCDTKRLTARGVLVTVRERTSRPGDDGEERELPADIVVLATGFKRPNIGFLPEDLFPEAYARPDLYLQNFSTEDWSVVLTNSAYQNAIGTVGHVHIGIYTRILLTLLLDKNARPMPHDMKLWVDVVRFVKRGAKGGALGFFTYAELTIWILLFHLFRPDRLRWLFFIMQGWGVYPGSYDPKEE